MYLFRNREVQIHICSALGILLTALALTWAFLPEAFPFVVFIFLLLEGLWFFEVRKRYQDIRELSRQMDEILHGNLLPDLSHFSEGDLEILRDEIYKMTVMLREQSERLSVEKGLLSDALADISHQIRTPLTALFLMLSRIQNTAGLSPENRILIREMEQMLSRIEWLITSLLKMSRLDSGTVHFEFQETPVRDLILEALKPLEISMELHQKELVLKGEEGILVHCDRAWTLEALGNVLKNSVEYTPNGGTLTVTYKRNPLFTEIRILDSGEGIPPEDLPHLFERFYRGKNSGKGSFGIGLSLSRMILSRENAVILARNSPDGGGVFLLRFYPPLL